jgi:hypothetical protein
VLSTSCLYVNYNLSFFPIQKSPYNFDMALRRGKKRSPPIEGQNKDMLDSKEPAGLQFLTFTHVDQITDPETKRKVRSHVMHGVQQKLRGGKGNEKGKGIEDVVLDISSLSETHLGPSDYHHGLSYPGSLGSGQSDPFKQYPVAMNIRSHELYDHCTVPLCRIVWFLLISASAWQDLSDVQDAE